MSERVELLCAVAFWGAARAPEQSGAAQRVPLKSEK